MYTIYEVPGVKVGCTSRSPEVRVKEQGYTQFRVVEVVVDIKVASERERYWQEELGYREKKVNSYVNILQIQKITTKPEIRAKAASKRKETIKVSERWKEGKKISEQKHKKPVLQFDKQGTFIKEWPSATDAQKAGVGLKRDIISTCRGRQRTSAGYIWKYKSML